MKYCSRCKRYKDDYLFHNSKHGKNNLDHYCKVCSSILAKTRKQARRKMNQCFECGTILTDIKYKRCIICRKRARKYDARRRDKRKQNQRCVLCGSLFDTLRGYCSKCKDNAKLRARLIRKQRRQDGLCVQCGQKNTGRYRRCDDCRIKNRIYAKTKKQNDINYRLKANLRTRLWQALKSNQKTGSIMNYLGCSIVQYKDYLKNLFQDGMSWDNYGLGEGQWNIDHIVPLSHFNLSLARHCRKALHYTNTQPMWSIENSRKGDRYESTSKC